MKSKGKKVVAIIKEDHAENWCFVCKDGGDIRICDYKQCLKSYHPSCVDKDESFLTSESYWACAWHKCFICHRSSHLHCYTCPKAVCRRCLPSADFLLVKGQNGFCNSCLKLALLIEENKDYDSDGERVDFTDKETCEGLFMEYYMIIKEEEGFKSGDIYAAQDRVTMKKKHQFGSGLEEFDDEEEEEEISDYDDVEYKKKRGRSRKEKRSERHKSALKTPIKSNKHQFVGWASRSLIDFLTSIGKSTSEKLSQHDVTSIVNEYVKENKLFHQEKKRMIICDAQLKSLFRRKTMSKNRVYDLLEAHFAENHEESDEEVQEDESGSDSEDKNEGLLGACKKRKADMEKKSLKKERENKGYQNCFAAIVVENVKLVYLKRSLLQEIVKVPESFEEKVIGCFVRAKSDPYDYRSRNSHQLMQVKGIKTISTGENNTEVMLLFSDMPKEIRMSLLSDDDFSEEECEDLRKKMLAGQCDRPRVEDLQKKAEMLHKDITKHWIKKQLALWQILIDRANEKGWRRELFEYLEKRKRLQTPSEVSKLLENVPTVTPDISDIDSSPGDTINDMRSDEDSPKSILQRNNSSGLSDAWQGNRTSEKNVRDGDAPSSPPPESKHDNITTTEPSQPTSEECAQEVHTTRNSSQKGLMTDVIELLSDDENANDCKASAVFENEKNEDVENKIWCIKGPNGEENRCSLSVLEKWSQRSPYALAFKVWKEDESEENAIWLRDAISMAFPKK